MAKAANDASKDDSKADDKGDRWECQSCKILNGCDEWRCTACFTDRVMSKDEFEKSIPSKMNGLIKLKPEAGFEYRDDIEVPDLEDNEVLVKSERVGICGSDILLHDWGKLAAMIAKIPFTPGHEASGLVVRIGKNSKLKIGDRVAIENHFFCGKCYQCLHNRKDICNNMSQFGHGKGTTQGGCSNYFKVKEDYCYVLQHRDTTWRDAALLEPLGVAVNACNRVGIKEDMFDEKKESNVNNMLVNNDEKINVLVIGAGTIGCLAVAVTKAYGKDKVNILCIDLIDWKLEIAKKYGANIINILKYKNGKFEDKLNDFLKFTNGYGFDKIIECSGHSETISEMFKYLRKGGEAVLIGLPKQEVKFDTPMPDLVFKSLTLHSIHGRRIFDTWIQSENLINKKLINLDLVVTEEIALSNFKQGYEKLKSGNALKIIFDPTK